PFSFLIQSPMALAMLIPHRWRWGHFSRAWRCIACGDMTWGRYHRIATPDQIAPDPSRAKVSIPQSYVDRTAGARYSADGPTRSRQVDPDAPVVRPGRPGQRPHHYRQENFLARGTCRRVSGVSYRAPECKIRLPGPGGGRRRHAPT